MTENFSVAGRRRNYLTVRSLSVAKYEDTYLSHSRIEKLFRNP